MQKIEEVSNPIIGEKYLVPSIHVSNDFFDRLQTFHHYLPAHHKEQYLRCMPIIGPVHEDKEIIDFPDNHWHIDWRFINDYLWKSWDELRIRSFLRLIPSIMLMVLREDKTIKGTFDYREFPMVREMGVYPNASFRYTLAYKYEGTKLKDCLTCPHKGIPLKGLTPDKDGIVKCPGHGLRWNVKSKELASCE